MTKQHLPKQSLFQWEESQRRPFAGPTSVHSIAPTPSGRKRLSRHPLSQAFGKQSAAARQELTDKLRQSGQVREIITLDDQILLDWDVYNAAVDLGLTVRLTEFRGKDPLAFIIVNCLRHPQWDKGQRAIIAVRLHSWRDRGRPGKSVLSTDLIPSDDDADPKNRNPTSTADMAEAAQASATYITRAKRLETLGLSDAVISGELRFAEAHRRAKLVLDAGLGDAVSHGTREFEAAYHEASMIADAGLLTRVKAGELTCDKAYQMVLAGATGETPSMRPHRPTRAELAHRLAELEIENQCLAQELQAKAPEHGATVTRYRQQVRSLQCDLERAETRVATAEAEVKRLTSVLCHSGRAA